MAMSAGFACTSAEGKSTENGDADVSGSRRVRWMGR
jgi:hypothetical protein